MATTPAAVTAGRDSVL